MSSEGKDDICTDGACVTVPLVIADGHTTGISFQESMIQEDGSAPVQSTVTLSEVEYNGLQQKIESGDRKLRALKNIHLLIREKDEELSSLKEKNKSYQDVLMMSELKCSQFLRLATKLARQNTDDQQAFSSHKKSERDVDEQQLQGNTKISQFPSFQVSNIGTGNTRTGEGTTRTEELKETAPDDSTRLDSLETDEASTQDYLLPSDHRNRLEADMEQSDILTSKLPFEFGKYAKHAEHITSSDCHKNIKQNDLENPTESLNLKPRSFAVQHSDVSGKLPGVSKDLVIKLMQQNVRLKQLLRQVLSSRGTDVEDYLERQEYVDVVEQLRQEIRLLQLRVKNLEELLASVRNSDTDDLAKRSQQLEETVLKQNRMLVVKQTMINAFSKRCEELEDQVRLSKPGSTTKASDSKTIQILNDRIVEDAGTTTSNQNPSSPSSTCRELAMDGNACLELVGRSNSPKTELITTLCRPSAIRSSTSLICTRCDREFLETERDKYSDHCRKCTDD